MKTLRHWSAFNWAACIGFRFNCWTCTLLIFGAGLLAILGASSDADAAGDCPPTKACQLMELSYQGCSKKKADDCVRFVRHFSELASLTCAKKSELDMSEVKVAAVQICDAHKDFTLASYTEMLAGLNTPEAQKFFSSEKFRHSVQKTPVGEEYIDRSKDLEQKLADKAKPKSKSTAKDEAPDVNSSADGAFKKANVDLNKQDDPIK